MAESQGFEPWVPFGDTAFRVLHLRPLGQLSVFNYIGGKLSRGDLPPLSRFLPKNASSALWEELPGRTAETFELSGLNIAITMGNPPDESAIREHDFECCTFDHSDNSPFETYSVVKASPRKTGRKTARQMF